MKVIYILFKNCETNIMKKPACMQGTVFELEILELGSILRGIDTFPGENSERIVFDPF